MRHRWNDINMLDVFGMIQDNDDVLYAGLTYFQVKWQMYDLYLMQVKINVFEMLEYRVCLLSRMLTTAHSRARAA